MTDLTKLKEWEALQRHHHDIANEHMRDWFASDPTRASRFTLSSGELQLDYSRNRIHPQTLHLLTELANRTGLKQKIEDLMTGQPLNITEKRPALHTALRDQQQAPFFVDKIDVANQIATTQAAMHTFVTDIHAGNWKGATGKPIKHIVNIGIGGSYAGPMMCIHALANFAITSLQFHFIASVDKDHLDEILKKIEPETTLFIISSKSFATLETLTNAKSVIAWMTKQLGDTQTIFQHHFIAITAAKDKALAFGLPDANIFPLWDWVGGRYSIWSAIGLPLMLMIGQKQFSEFLEGAYEMDCHFRQAEFSENMPVLLALLGIWHMNFFGAQAHAIVPYSHRLRYLVPYLQQAEMESNGKSVALTGNAVNYMTSPVLFGEEGAIGQHSYHQLLHQGKHLIPVDFILVDKPAAEKTFHHDILMASALSQAKALMCGKTFNQAKAELSADHPERDMLAHHRVIAGNKPSNIIFLKRLNPKNLGALIALYEHKIFVQGAIWNINSFDQWGVELGKELLPAILAQVQMDKR